MQTRADIFWRCPRRRHAVCSPSKKIIYIYVCMYMNPLLPHPTPDGEGRKWFRGRNTKKKNRNSPTQLEGRSKSSNREQEKDEHADEDDHEDQSHILCAKKVATKQQQKIMPTTMVVAISKSGNENFFRFRFFFCIPPMRTTFEKGCINWRKIIQLITDSWPIRKGFSRIFPAASGFWLKLSQL